MLDKLLHRFLPPRAAILLVALVALGALLILAATLPDAVLRSGAAPFPIFESGEPVEPPEFVLPAAFLDILVIVVWSLFLISLGYLIFDRERRRTFPKLVVQIMYMLFWALLFVFILQTGIPEESEAVEEESTAPADLPAATMENPGLEEQLEEFVITAEPPAVVEIIVTTLFLTGLAALLYFGWRHLRTQPPPSPALADLSRLSQLAIDEIRQGQQLEEVILRCYREMARTVATQRGVQRGRGVTPREFEQALAHSGLPPRPVQRLTRLFEQVRYGDYTPGHRDRLEAVDSLQAIVDACGQRAGGRRVAER